MTLRSGERWASAWVMRPIRTCSSTSEWSRLICSSARLAQPVTAAVAHVEDQHAAPSVTRPTSVVPMPLSWSVLLGAGMDRLVGGADGLFDHSSSGGLRLGLARSLSTRSTS